MKPIMITTEGGIDNWTQSGQYQNSKTQITTGVSEVVLEYNTEDYKLVVENGKVVVKRKDKNVEI